jgi:hypothetical protein
MNNIQQFIESIENETYDDSTITGEALDLVMATINIDGADMTDAECLETIAEIIEAWRVTQIMDAIKAR